MTAFTVATPTYASPPAQRPPGPVVRARYDAAQTTDDNKRHWANADDLSANAANSPGVRRILRRRARYETSNNPNIRGLIRRISRDLIGTGPRLQLSAGDDPAQQAAARKVEKSFKKWARAITLGRKLRVMTTQKVRDGEGFAIVVTNPKVRHAVKIDLRLVEPEQVTTPMLAFTDPLAVDGIKFDKWGNPVGYHVLKQHPGDQRGGDPLAVDTVPAESMIHWFEQDRAGQARGIPEIASMLPLAAYQRRYILATVAAAEFAASVAGVLETDLPPGQAPETTDPEKAFDLMPVERAGLLSTPAGAKLKQFEAEQPTTTFAEFNGELSGMEGQAVGAPRNVMTGNSSGYNFSSGRLDHAGYHAGLWVDRDEIRDVALDPLFREWVDEATLVEGLIPPELPPADEWEWDWHWDGFGAIDPVKEAAAAAARMANGTSTLAEECAADGKDWREVMRQRAAESAEAKRQGLPDPHAAPNAPAPPVPEPDEEPVHDDD